MFFSGICRAARESTSGGGVQKERDRQVLLDQLREERRRRQGLRQQAAAAIKIQQPPSPWMNQRPLGVDVNVAYVENHDDVDRGVPHQPMTQIFIEIASEFSSDFAGTTGTFIVHLPVKGKDTIDTVKSKITDRVRSHKSGSPLNYILEGLFVLVFKRRLMVDLWTLHECDIKNQDTVVLCRKQEFLITVLVVLADESSEVQVHGVRVHSFDKVMKLKSTVKQLAGISSKKNIVLRFQEIWMEDDDMCLFEYGIVELNRGRGTFIVEAVEYDASQEMQQD